MPLELGELVTRVDLPLSGVARLKALTSSGAILETFADGAWVQSRTAAPLEALEPATAPEVVAARHNGRLPPARGIFAIDDEDLRLSLGRPGFTEAEIDAIMMDPNEDRELKMWLIAYLTPRGYPTIL